MSVMKLLDPGSQMLCDSPEDSSNDSRPHSQLLMGLLSPNPSDVPSMLKFIYNRELTGLGEYLKIFANVWWSTNGTLNVRHRHHLNSPAAAEFIYNRVEGRKFPV
ncbi:hypothetical protein DAPPUDRAFT_244837 [Daphnia pulex]|uniref:Uncharacterized protein n=1 Tax=Daphnia pulex TaxID=6669 RepID=E9GLZ5_DAPPU|nr:hypothetical protein DAPPUDRAFT_244837 [Daphnia pulex]|eukprot:EFX79599.1 hypothetical protein DAPPUDRAFT_244837 [Daphnia pulex]